MSKTVLVTNDDIKKIVKESVCRIIKEADRHRPGYWKERWAKQKAEKEANGETKPKVKKPKPKKDRHRPGYYHDYNQAHPERLNRGFTKGYVNGNVDDGLKMRFLPDEYIIGYDEIGRPITNHPLSDMLRNKEMEWHDDDWYEGINDD